MHKHPAMLPTVPDIRPSSFVRHSFIHRPMNLSDSIIINGDYAVIFDLAANVQAWDRILPHYRYVHILKRNGNRKLVAMSAWRDFIPVTWSAIETVHPGTADQPGRITFRHVRGMVKGMEVEWSFQVRADRSDVLVTISHHLDNPPFPVKILGAKLTEVVVGHGFISYIAGKTLKRIKELAERDVKRDIGSEK